MASFKKYHGPGPTDWIQPIRKGYKFVCCDCCLVHNMDFRVKNKRAQFRVSRNNRSTALARRHNGITVTH